MNFKLFVKAIFKAVLYFLTYYLCQIAVILIAGIIGGLLAPTDQLHTVESFGNLLVKYSGYLTIISGILAVLTFFAVTKIRKNTIAKRLNLTVVGGVECIFIIVFGAALNAVTTVIVSLIPFPESWIYEYERASSSIINMDMVSYLLLTIVFAPLIEEIVFRGYIYKSLKSGMPTLAAMILASWLFGAAHGQIVWVIYSSILGFILAFVFEKYSSIVAPILLHFGFNLFSFFLGLIPEMSIYAVPIVFLVSFAVVAGGFYRINRNSKHKIEIFMSGDNK